MKIWQEIRRRRVFRFAGVYIVAAWLVFQVADVFFPAWGIPDSSLQYLLYAAFACFPVALVFSWFYDITSSGISRTPASSEDDSAEFPLGKKDYLVLAGLLIVASTIFYNSFDQVVQSAGSETVQQHTAVDKPENSLAVLPFDSLDDNLDTGFFSAGVSEEIMHRLASVQSLKVIGRKSSFAFGDTDMGMERISDILGVRYLLDGSIRRAGDQVRVTARLVDDTGFQLWSETFDGSLSGIFRFQSDIAEKVASRITRELVVLKSPDPTKNTANIEAYRQYLIGREYFTRRPPNWAQLAIGAYRQSIEADPNYAPPYAGLSMVLRMSATVSSYEGTLKEAKILNDRALELDPFLAEGWMAKGLPIQIDPDFDTVQAIEDLEYALELNPLLVNAYNWLAINRGANKDIEGMFEARERGLAVDPLNPVLLMNSADVYLARNDFSGWKSQILRLLDLPAPPTLVYGILAIKHEEYGFYKEALKWYKEGIRVAISSRERMSLTGLLLLYEKLAMTELADTWLQYIYAQTTDDPVGILYSHLALSVARGEQDDTARLLVDLINAENINIENPPGHFVKDLGDLLSLTGDYQTAIPLLERFLQPAEPLTLRFNNPEDVFRLQLLAFDYEQSGMQESANAMKDRAEKMTSNIFEVGNFTSDPLIQLLPAMNHAAGGRFRESAIALRAAFNAGWRDYYAERHMPYWRGAWESEEFAPVVADIIEALEEQRVQVEAVEAENDFRAEFDALIAGA